MSKETIIKGKKRSLNVRFQNKVQRNFKRNEQQGNVKVCKCAYVSRVSQN